MGARAAVGVEQVVDEPGVIETEPLGQREVVEHLVPGRFAWLRKKPKRTGGVAAAGWFVDHLPGLTVSSTLGD